MRYLLTALLLTLTACAIPTPALAADPTLTLIYEGKLRDMVGTHNTALGPDGVVDAAFTVVLGGGARTVTSLKLDSSGPGTWDTSIAAPGYWVLGVAPTMLAPLVNVQATTAVTLPVADGGRFVVFAADYQNMEFLPGRKITLAAKFSDGATATGLLTISSHFTPTEKNNELLYRNAMISLTESFWSNAIEPILSNYLTPATKVLITRATLSTLNVFDEANDAYSSLVGDVAVDQDGTPGFILLSASRTARLDRMRHHTKRLIPGDRGLIPQAIGEWEAAKRVCAAPECQARIAWVVVKLTQAMDHLKAFDTTLPYADPKPPNIDPTRFAKEAVIGPHGVFKQTQWDDWRGRVYTNRTARHLVTSIQMAPDTWDFTSFGRPLINLGLILKHSIDVTAATSNMPGSAADAFGGTLESLRILTEVMPLAQHFFFFEVERYMLAMDKGHAGFNGQVRAGLIIFADGWKHLNFAGWQLMIFPGCPPVCRVGR